MRKPQKVETLWLALPSFVPIFGGKPPELNEPGLFGVQSKAKLVQPCLQCIEKLIGLVSMLESHHEIVGITNDDDITAGVLPPPAIDPQVQDVMQEDVREHGRYDSSHTIDNFEFEQIFRYVRNWNKIVVDK